MVEYTDSLVAEITNYLEVACRITAIISKFENFNKGV